MTNEDHVTKLVSQTLDSFDSQNQSIASLVRQAIRIAALRHDYLNQLRFQLETVDFTTRSRAAAAALLPTKENLQTLLGEDEFLNQYMSVHKQWEHNRASTETGNIYATSIGQIEKQLKTLETAEADFVVPDNLTQIDTYFMARDANAARATLIPLQRQLESIIERVRQTVYDFLVAAEQELQAGQRTATIFERGQEYVHKALSTRAPDALAKFVGAQERLETGNSEDLAQALTSCRRMIKALADALYPATDEKVIGTDGVSRSMSADAYQNRILQYVIEKVGKHDQGEVVQETLRSLGHRLRALNGLASKGVHNEVSLAEAENCVAWTYMLAADVLRIADGTAPISAATPETTEAEANAF